VHERNARVSSVAACAITPCRALPAPSCRGEHPEAGLRHAITSLWSPKIDSACVATRARRDVHHVGVSSPAILYMLGIISSRPCDAVKVVVSAPA
jgi:hypothetical protein